MIFFETGFFWLETESCSTKKNIIHLACIILHEWKLCYESIVDVDVHLQLQIWLKIGWQLALWHQNSTYINKFHFVIFHGEIISFPFLHVYYYKFVVVSICEFNYSFKWKASAFELMYHLNFILWNCIKFQIPNEKFIPISNIRPFECFWEKFLST